MRSYSQYERRRRPDRISYSPSFVRRQTHALASGVRKSIYSCNRAIRSFLALAGREPTLIIDHYIAAASLQTQDFNLSFYGVNKRGLNTSPFGKSLIQRTLMIIPPCKHLMNDLLMNPEQCLQLTSPSFRFGMTGIAFLSLRQNIPDGMKFIVLTKKMATA